MPRACLSMHRFNWYGTSMVGAERGAEVRVPYARPYDFTISVRLSIINLLNAIEYTD